MNIWELTFMVQFIVAIGITGFKLYNIMNKGDKCSKGMIFLLFAAFWVTWGLGLIILLNNPTELIYSVLFMFESWFILLMGAAFIGEVLLMLGVVGTKVSDYTDPLKIKG